MEGITWCECPKADVCSLTANSRWLSVLLCDVGATDRIPPIDLGETRGMNITTTCTFCLYAAELLVLVARRSRARLAPGLHRLVTKPKVFPVRTPHWPAYSLNVLCWLSS
jgi:hypothetical protein